MIRLNSATRACLLDSTRAGSLMHELLSGAPIVIRAGDPLGGLYEIDCSDANCRELLDIASKHCPDSVGEVESAIKRVGG